MQINKLENIQPIFKNCLKVKESSDYFIPARFTEKQLKVYSDNPQWKINSLCPAGICFDFYTNSSFFEFEFKVENINRNWIYFDVFINDVFVRSIGKNEVEASFNKFYYHIQENENTENRVTVYLPYTVEIAIRDINLSDDAYIKKTNAYPNNLLCLGDSITQGMASKYPSEIYPVQVARFLNANLVNQGIGGYCFNKESLDHEFFFKPDIITVAYGTNDWSKCKSYKEFYQNCLEYFQKLCEIFSQAKIFVITPIWRKDLHEITAVGEFSLIDTAIKEICRNYSQIHVVDGISLVPNIDDCYGDERVLHPNDKGCLHYAINLIKYINEYKVEKVSNMQE